MDGTGSETFWTLNLFVIVPSHVMQLQRGRTSKRSSLPLLIPFFVYIALLCYAQLPTHNYASDAIVNATGFIALVPSLLHLGRN